MLSPEHLLEQAERLLIPPSGEDRPRLTDRCRAVSATYYAVFYAGLIAAADQSLGDEVRGTKLYSLAYRAIDHGKMRSLYQEIRKQNSQRYDVFAPQGGWGNAITGYADSFVTLNEQRMLADYDPCHIITPSEVETYITIGRSAIQLLANAETEPKKAFLTLLLFPVR